MSHSRIQFAPSFGIRAVVLCTVVLLGHGVPPHADDPVVDRLAILQSQAIANGRSPLAYWGTHPDDYVHWDKHSNRLIPVYTFGTANMTGEANLDAYINENSCYRSAKRIGDLYGRVPENTLNPNAEYMDQCDLATLQRAAIAAGKRYVFLVIFDGMDWQTTQAAAIYRARSVSYTSGRGRGLHFQDYAADDTTQFGWMVTSPHNHGTEVDVDNQSISIVGGTIQGGYDAAAGGTSPWETEPNPDYLISENIGHGPVHAYTDSASSATSMTVGRKTYNGAINVGPYGEPLVPIARDLQRDGFSVGVVSNVPFCHATPAAAYANNVSRKDYQDIARDLLGLPNIVHRNTPLPGMDVALGAGYGEIEMAGTAEQGNNFVRGSKYITVNDLNRADVRNGGKYVLAIRQRGRSGSELLQEKADLAIRTNARLFGFFGVVGGHLPFATANGDYHPVRDRAGKLEKYSVADLNENPTLAELTAAAISVLHAKQTPFWVMVEAGDIDWANHDNNIDSSIGAVLSGDDAVRVITNWVDENSNWDETLMILTADHGHALHLVEPQALAGPGQNR